MPPAHTQIHEGTPPAGHVSDRILIVLRGPSAVGKSTIASGLRSAFERRELAIVRQDVIRRDLLRERDEPGAHNIDLIKINAEFSLQRGFHTCLEGILDAGRYGAMLADLAASHRGPQFWFYLHADFETTVERHATKPQAAKFGADVLAGWYRDMDLLGSGIETVIGQDSSADQTLAQILQTTGLLHR